MFNFFEKRDTQLQQDVINELNWDPSVSSGQISVLAKDGVVTLRGSVPHYYEKSTAESGAQRVSGVRAVVDELTVNIMGSYERSDEDIAHAALNALEWNYSAPKDVKLSVEKGWVTLRGETEWEYERNAANNSVRQLMGVCGVTNNISIKSKIQPDDVKQRIEKALKRAAEKESKNIVVTVMGNQVTLAGNVHSFTEVGVAGLAAWNAPGVMVVHNDLKIAE